jgi:hypothetical protein
MRRIQALFALATLAFAGMTLPHAASAATVCGVVQQNPNSWPYTKEYDCTSSDGSPSTSDANTNSEAISGQTHGLAYEQLNQLQISSYIFEDPADFKSYTAFTSQPTPDANAFGTVVLDANKMPTAIISFEKNGNGVATPSASYSAGRAVGHALDYTLGYVMNGGVITLPATPMSSSSIFASELAYDWSVLNAMSPCTAGGQGVFNNKTDHNGAYICTTSGSGATLSAGYSGNVQNVLKTAWPGIYDTNANIFAEIYGTTYIGSENTRDQYLNQYFTCTNSLEILASNGGKISNSTTSPPLPSACPVPPIQTSCNQIFYGDPTNGYPSYGYIFDCSNPTTNTANGTAGMMTKLGGTSTTPNPIKANLVANHSYIYFFSSQSDFNNAFVNQAGFNYGTRKAPSIANANAFTFPYGKVWYTVMNTLSSAGSDYSKQAYIVSHELGHVTDFTTGQPSQSVATTPASSPFDIAVQNDFLNLEWYNLSAGQVRKPCWVQGQVPSDSSNGTTAAPYTGPLVGVTDPATITAQNTQGYQFCNFGTMQSTSINLWGSKTIPQIFQGIDGYNRGQDDLKFDTDSGNLGFNPGIAYKTGWRELFAQAFAIQAKTDLNSTSNVPALDIAVLNGYFGCVAGLGSTGTSPSGIPFHSGWLHQVYTTSTGKPAGGAPTGCTTAPTTTPVR